MVTTMPAGETFGFEMMILMSIMLWGGGDMANVMRLLLLGMRCSHRVLLDGPQRDDA